MNLSGIPKQVAVGNLFHNFFSFNISEGIEVSRHIPFIHFFSSIPFSKEL